MANKKSNGKGGSSRTLLAAAAAAAAAGYYFYASKDAGKNRKIAAKWASDLKSDVLKQAKKLKGVDQKTFLKLVSATAQTYATARNIDRGDVQRAASELKANWRTMMQDAGKGVAAVKKTVSKSITKAKRKTAKGRRS